MLGSEAGGRWSEGRPSIFGVGWSPNTFWRVPLKGPTTSSTNCALGIFTFEVHRAPFRRIGFRGCRQVRSGTYRFPVLGAKTPLSPDVYLAVEGGGGGDAQPRASSPAQLFGYLQQKLQSGTI